MSRIRKPSRGKAPVVPPTPPTPDGPPPTRGGCKISKLFSSYSSKRLANKPFVCRKDLTVLPSRSLPSSLLRIVFYCRVQGENSQILLANALTGSSGNSAVNPLGFKAI